ncbi:MAG TPA: DUF1015 domain-containing protein, partial [Candidatus Saccharimonadia bacterium]|nr:DUF1015 domain-containing protein [Candidatus Saccharimonadia bacterium]
DPAAVGDLGDVISPPYDVVSPALQARLVDRHPRNSIRLDLPPSEPGDGPDDRYRRAAASFVSWRTDGTLRKDLTPSFYIYEMAYRPPGEVRERLQRGFFARLTLEPFGPGSGVLAHERTLGGPKADRLSLLSATGANFSPVVGLYDSPHGDSGLILDALTASEADESVVDDDGVRHRVWVVPAGARDDGGPVDRLIAMAEVGPIVIADGHHRYATALDYRAGRGARRACTEDPPYETIFVLLFDLAATELTILPTHRVVDGEPTGDALLSRLSQLFEVERLASSGDLIGAFSPAASPSGADGGGTRIGVWSAGQAAVLRARPGALDALLDGQATPATRGLGVTVLETAMLAIFGLDQAAVARGERVRYVKGAADAVDAAGPSGTAFLLDPTAAADVVRVARAGELMPQKSTYFSPKPVTGLLFAPGEW